MQIEDLNLDEQILIVEELDLLGLISIAGTNGHFSKLAADVYRRKHSKKVLKLIDPFIVGHDNILETKDTIYIRQIHTILRFFEYFGHVITNMVIGFSSSNIHPINENSINAIAESINFYCFESLIEFKVNNYHKTFFDQMKMPFRKIEILSIRGVFNSLSSKTLAFNELFPAVDHLTLTHVEVLDLNCIDFEFSSMKQLSVEICQHNNPHRFTEEHFSKLLKRNPQIQSLTLGSSSRSFLKNVSESLPNIEHLGLFHYFPFHAEPKETIIFENVKNLTVFSSAESVPKYVEFKKLTELHTENIPILYNNKWVEFVEKSPFLNKLYVENGAIDNEQLARLAAMDLILTEASFNLELNVVDEIIVRF